MCGPPNTLMQPTNANGAGAPFAPEPPLADSLQPLLHDRRLWRGQEAPARDISVLLPYLLLQAGLLEDGDLASVVELVLSDALHHKADIVGLAGNALAQAAVSGRLFSLVCGELVGTPFGTPLRTRRMVVRDA